MDPKTCSRCNQAYPQNRFKGRVNYPGFPIEGLAMIIFGGEVDRQFPLCDDCLFSFMRWIKGEDKSLSLDTPDPSEELRKAIAEVTRQIETCIGERLKVLTSMTEKIATLELPEVKERNVTQDGFYQAFEAMLAAQPGQGETKIINDRLWLDCS